MLLKKIGKVKYSNSTNNDDNKKLDNGSAKSQMTGQTSSKIGGVITNMSLHDQKHSQMATINSRK